MCLVGGLDIHKGHGGGLPAILRLFFVTEDFHTLDSTKSFKIFFDAVFSDVFREVAHPQVPGLSYHGGFTACPRGRGAGRRRSFAGTKNAALKGRDLAAVFYSPASIPRIVCGFLLPAFEAAKMVGGVTRLDHVMRNLVTSHNPRRITQKKTSLHTNNNLKN